LFANGSYPSASTPARVILSILTHASLGGVDGDYQFRIDPVLKPALVSGDETSLRDRDPIFAPSVYDSILGATLEVLGPPMHAEIAGAGFAGLAAAIALHRRGWSVIVHEKEPELRAFGAGIFIWENGQRVLQAIGAYPDMARGAHQAPGYETRRNGVCVSFETINGGNPFLLMTMTRQHLYSAILASVAREGIEIVTRSEAVAARPEGVLELASGRRRKADLVIAADGVRSAVRESLGIACSRRKYQDGIVRVLVERGSFVGGAWDHVIDFWAFEPRTLRILYAPCEDGRLYMAMMSPRDDKQASKLPVDPTVWASAFPMLAPAIKSVGSRGRYDVYETTRLDSWSVGHVAIVGDAAHAMPPTLAQGACLAMMNALSLAEFVSEGSDLTVDLQRWEKRERALTDHTQSRSAELARTRALGSGMQWDDIGMRAARHVPTGTRPEEFSRLRPSAGI
jgi:2-methyl-3-hydroxypyridine 5-carboxylic acid dioxygenase